MTGDLRVLLISPVRGVDPNSGDVTYTEQLLASPPPGVEYTTYDEAIADGMLVEVGTRETVETGPPLRRAQSAAFAVWRKAEGVARKSGLVYRERLRHFRVTPGAFDLVHVHVFHTRFLGQHPPVVFSASGPLRWVYQDAWGWSARRVRAAEAVDKAVGALWGATMCGGRPGQASRLVASSHDYRRWLVEHRRAGGDVVTVVPNYLALDVTPVRVPERVTQLGFVAKDFDAKGGRILLEAFAQLRRDHPDLRLTVVGSEPDPVVPEGVTWLPFVPREQMLAEVLPSIQVFVYPTLFDASTPYGPMEALAHGIPLVVPEYRALPEMVGGGGGRVTLPGDAGSVAAAVTELLDVETWTVASRAARARFEDHFSAQAQAPRLRGVYDQAMGQPVSRKDAGTRV